VTTGPADDPSIVDEDWLLRRIPPSQMPYNDARGRRWPSSAAFTPSTGDTEVSAYLDSELQDLGLDHEAVVEAHDGYAVARFPVGLPRSLDRGVIRDPSTDSARPLACDPAHALITGRTGDNKNQWRRIGRLLFDNPAVTIMKEPGEDPTGTG